jgi:hypothetical protein
MSIHRYNARRDENEQPIVNALRAIGRHVTRLSGEGVCDLLVIRPARELPVFVCETIEQAIDAAQTDDLVLIEVKMPGKGLSKAQKKWHSEVLCD